jgi:hypothetical protein
MGIGAVERRLSRRSPALNDRSRTENSVNPTEKGEQQ